jgi:hypothetical protein
VGERVGEPAGECVGLTKSLMLDNFGFFGKFGFFGFFWLLNVFFGLFGQFWLYFGFFGNF